MNERELQSTLKRLAAARALQPNAQRLKLYKHRLLAEVNRSTLALEKRRLTGGESIHLKYLKTLRSVMLHQYVAALGIFIMVVALPTSYIAQAAVPGDALWPVKITIEKAEVAMAFNAERESRVHLRHVQRRLDELHVVTSRVNDTNRNKNISQLVRRLEKDVTAAGQSFKIAKDTDVTSNPDAVIALARDLNEKVGAVAKVLEDNKNVIIAENNASLPKVGSPESLVGTSTTSTLITTGDDDGFPSTTPRFPETLLADTAKEKRAIVDVITEVQLVNEYISYDTLGSLITIIEDRGGSTNRGEVVRWLGEKVDEQVKQVGLIEKAIELVSNDFQLQRKEARENIKNAEHYLSVSKDMMTLDNLSAALKNLMHAKGSIEVTARLLRDVGEGGGLLTETIAVPVSESSSDSGDSESTNNATTSPVTIQSLPIENILLLNEEEDVMKAVE